MSIVQLSYWFHRKLSLSTTLPSLKLMKNAKMAKNDKIPEKLQPAMVKDYTEHR